MACYLALAFSGATQWRLAASLANRQLRTPARRRGSTGGCWHATRTDSVYPLQCRCGSDVDAQGRHAMDCKKVPGRVARHQVLNNIILRAINAADVPAVNLVKEPSGLNRQNGKRPDGLSLIPWQSGKPLLWDVTLASTLAGSCGHSRDWSRTCS